MISHIWVIKLLKDIENDLFFLLDVLAWLIKVDEVEDHTNQFFHAFPLGIVQFTSENVWIHVEELLQVV